MQAAEEVEMLLEKIADGVIARPIGEIDRSRAPSLRVQIEEIQLSGPQRLVVDLSHVPYIDSSVIAVLVEAVQRAHCGSGIVILCGVEDRVRSVFEISRLDKTLFTIVSTVDEAVALPNRRRFRRFRVSGLNCDAGEVLDVSAAGVKLQSRRKFKGIVNVRLWNEMTEVVLPASIVWSRRLGFRKHEAGLRFVNMCADAAKKLAMILTPVIDEGGWSLEEIGDRLPAPVAVG